MCVRRREGEREANIVYRLPSTPTPTATQACAPTWNRTGDLSVCRTTPNQLSHTG